MLAIMLRVVLLYNQKKGRSLKMNIENAVKYARDTIINRDCVDVFECINDVANMYATSYNEYMEIYNKLIIILDANS